MRWRNIRAACICVAVVGGALLYSLGLQKLLAPEKFSGPYAALVRIEGLIDAEQRANAHKVIAALRSAFEDARAKGAVWFTTRLEIARWWQAHHTEFAPAR